MRQRYVWTVCGESPRCPAASFSAAPSTPDRTMPPSRGERFNAVARERHSDGPNTLCPTPCQAARAPTTRRSVIGSRCRLESLIAFPPGGRRNMLLGIEPREFIRLQNVPLVPLIVVDPDLRRVVRTDRGALDLAEELLGGRLGLGVRRHPRQHRQALLRRRLDEPLAAQFARHCLNRQQASAPTLRRLGLERFG